MLVAQHFSTMEELLLLLVAEEVVLAVVEMVEMVVVQGKQDNLELEVVLDLLDQLLAMAQCPALEEVLQMEHLVVN